MALGAAETWSADMCIEYVLMNRKKSQYASVFNAGLQGK